MTPRWIIFISTIFLGTSSALALDIGPSGPVFLNEVESDTERDHDGDDGEGSRVSDERGDRGGREKEQDQRIAEAGEKLKNDRARPRGTQDIGAPRREAPCCLRLIQAGGAGPELQLERFEIGPPEFRGAGAQRALSLTIEAST